MAPNLVLLLLALISGAVNATEQKHDIEIKLYANGKSKNEKSSQLRLNLTNYYGSVWTVKTRIGSPGKEFELMIDTGSPDMWVVGHQCGTKACDAHVRYSPDESISSKTLPDDFEVAYASGDVTGATIKDTFSFNKAPELSNIEMIFGSLSSPPLTFQKRLRWYPFDGVLGLGYSGPTEGDSTEITGVKALKNILGNSKENNIFSLYLSKNEKKSSQLIIGAPDDTLHTGTISYIRISQPPAFWGADITSMMLKAATTTPQFEPICGRPRGCKAVFDTGSTLLQGPKQMVQILINDINVKEDCSNLESLPSLSLTLSGPDSSLTPSSSKSLEDYEAGLVPSVEVVLSPEDYVVRVPIAQSTREACFLGIKAHNLPDSMGSIWTLGSRFHQKYYTVFDASRQRIGIAEASL
mmetsp:Transcript_14198/g.21574  ORF Transcript_14198/g.21574 Transcript_14198/m.21574 type:complete len:410 (+) Transcript_14198:23-1252(+)